MAEKNATPTNEELIDAVKQKYSKAFRSDEEISKDWLFVLLNNWITKVTFPFYDFETIDYEKQIPKQGGALIISYHSFHNLDIIPAIFAVYQATGRIPRAIVHRVIFKVHPFLKSIGCTPGDRKTAVELLREGHVCGLIPGGGEEAMEGHENAYNLRWYSSSGRRRLGWAHVAKEAGVKVIPVAGINAQEMAFNIFAFVCNVLYISHMYDHLVRLPGRWGWVFYQLKSVLWYIVCTFLSFPIPIKCGVAAGEPLQFGENESVEDFADRAERALQDLMNKYNPGGLSYSRALKSRCIGKYITREKKD